MVERQVKQWSGNRSLRVWSRNKKCTGNGLVCVYFQAEPNAKMHHNAHKRVNFKDNLARIILSGA